MSLLPTQFACIAQLVEQLPCKHQVSSSNLLAGTISIAGEHRYSTRAHNPGMTGASPVPATTLEKGFIVQNSKPETLRRNVNTH